MTSTFSGHPFMTALVILLVVVPWSIWRQMHARAVTTEGLVKLPLIFAAAAIAALVAHVPATGDAALGYYALCAAMALVAGVLRGDRVSVWYKGATPMQRGNRATLTIWGVLIALKIALGTVARRPAGSGRGDRRDPRLPRADLRHPERDRRPPHHLAGAPSGR